jgi:hypothetical protein
MDFSWKWPIDMYRYLAGLTLVLSLSACDMDLKELLSRPLITFADFSGQQTVVEKSGIYLRTHAQVCLYKNYLNERTNKAFYVTDSGGYGWAADRVSEDVALEDALGYCKRSSKKHRCVLFDLNGKIQVQSKAINFDIDCCKDDCAADSDNSSDTKYSKEELEAMAKLGSNYALFRIGKAYLYGTNGYEQNPAKAIESLTKASNNGDSYAMAWLGYIYAEGLGVEKNMNKSRQWYELAAKNGSDYAKEKLELMKNVP